MDRTDEKILQFLKKDARMSYSELGEKLGMSRVGARKRVRALEEAGLIRGYRAVVQQPGEVTLLIDIYVKEGCTEAAEDYVLTQTAYVRQIYRTALEGHLHLVAVAPSPQEARYLGGALERGLEGMAEKITCRSVRAVLKDVYAGVSSAGRD